MSDTKDIPRVPLSFEDFIEAATTAALRASTRVSAEAAKLRPGDVIHPWPIWVGIIIRDPGNIETIGRASSQQ